MTKSFTVLTVSKRTGWEKGAQKSIRRQTTKPRRWVTVTENELSFDLKLPYPITFDAPFHATPSNLNKSLNEGLKHIHTDYVIFYQDFIDLPKDCFSKLMKLADSRTFVTTCTPNYDGSDDSRYLGVDQPRPCRPEEWETNVALAPMDMIRALGGFDERLDEGWSWDNVNLAKRAAMLGARFIIDESNRPILLPHEQTSKLEMELNGDRNERIIEDIRSGKQPLKLPYLK